MTHNFEAPRDGKIPTTADLFEETHRKEMRRFFVNIKGSNSKSVLDEDLALFSYGIQIL